MAQPNFIPMPWAENGQKQDPIPAEQTSAGNGRASWKTGFPIENTRPVSNGGVPANYQDFQGVLHTLSEFACYQQAGGIFTWSDELDYEVGARVLGSDNNVYVATANSGPSSVVTDPVGDTSGKWVTEPNITQASAAALEVASGFVTSGGYTINNGFTVTGGTINGQITSAQYASAIGNTSTNIGAAATPVYVSGGVITPCDGVAVTSAAQTFSGEKTFTSVISGGVTGNAGTATRLQTARNIQTNLANTSAASFNGTANITPGVTGTLAVANGGTGVTTIADIQAGKDGAGNTITSTYATKADVAEEMATKADIDGNYPDMTVGNAEQLVSEDYLTDTIPYTFRTAGGGVDIGDREYDELVGGTIAWNQLGRRAADYSATAEQGGQENIWFFASTSQFPLLVSGHKYLIYCMQDKTLTSCTRNTYTIQDKTTASYYYESIANIHLQKGLHGWIFNCPFTSKANVILWVNNPSDTVTFSNFQIYDLTAAFGTGIADYINSLETANAGAGVAWFRAHFPKNYHAYDPGSLQSVQAASHDMVGFNQWDEEWVACTNINENTGEIVDYGTLRYIASKNLIPVFPGSEYCFTVPGNVTTWLYAYDAEGNFTKTAFTAYGYATLTTTRTYTMPDGVYYVRFLVDTAYGTTYKNDICINLSWSGYRNGEYEPYEKNSYPLDSTLTLRGIPKLDASNNLYYDGDTYEADGTVSRRYGVCTIPNASWIVTGNLAYAHFSSVGLVNVAPASTSLERTAKTIGDSCAPTGISWADMVGSTGIQYIITYDDYFGINIGQATPTANDVNTWLTNHPLTIVYELATSSTETADAFQTPQIVSDFGTEQYVDAAVAAGTRDVAIPVGHDTRYTQNLRDKLRRLPNMPDSDGVYNVLYTGRQCEFIEAPIAQINSNTENIATNTADITALGTKTDITDKRVDNLAALMNGALSVQNTDSTSAYAKTVPSKAQPYAAVQKVGGRTVVWNQFVYNADFSLGTTGWSPNTLMTIDGDTATYTTENTGDYSNTISTTVNSIAGHKVLMYVEVMSSVNNPYRFRYPEVTTPVDATANTWLTLASIQTVASASTMFGFQSNADPNATYKFRKPRFIDLTLMFGSGNEPSTVAEFQAMFPTIDPAYNAGQLISAGVTGAVSVGKNLLPPAEAGTKTLNGITVISDGKGTFTITGATSTNSVTIIFDLPSDFVIPVSFGQGGNYCFCLNNTFVLSSGSGLRLLYDDTGVDSWEFNEVNRQNCVYVGMGRKTINKIGFLIGAGTSVNGTCSVAFMPFDGDTSNHYHFSPYMTATLPIPAAVQSLPGYGWSAGSVYNYIDWQRKVYVQRVGGITLTGTENITATDSGLASMQFVIPAAGALVVNGANPSVTSNKNLCSTIYVPVAWSSSPWGVDKSVSFYSDSKVRIKDNTYATTTEYKSFLATQYANGTPIVVYYQLQTPVETDISDLLSDDNLIATEPGGTVSFPSQLGDDYRIPVPSTEEYTIDMAPDTPSTDGTYTLQCTVTDGVATYSWVSA